MDKKRILAKGFSFTPSTSKEISETSIIRIFVAIVLLTLLILVAMIVFTWQSHKYLSKTEKLHFRIAQLNSQIIYIDEVMTDSARLAVATSDHSWEDKYNAYQPQLDLAIKDAMKTFPLLADTYQQIYSVNLALVEMQRKVFELVRNNNTKTASQLLQSYEYEDKKNIYTKNVNNAVRNLSFLEQQRLNKEQKITILTIILLVVIFPLVIILWLIVLNVLHKYFEERKRNELALGLSEQCFRAIADYTYSWELWVSPESNLLWTNPAVERVTGYSVAEFMKIPENLLSLVVEDDKAKVKKTLHSALNGSTGISLEFCMKTKDGHVIWTDMSWQPIRDKKGYSQGYRASIRDVTARKYAEAIEEETQRKLVTLMANLPGMAYSCKNDRNWTMDFLSEGCLELTGYQPSDFIQNAKLSYGDLIHHDDVEYVWQDIQKAVAKKQPFKLTYRIKTADKKQKWVWEMGRGVFNKAGKLLRLEGFITDITERKEIEEKLRLTQFAVDKSTVAVYWIDENANFIYANDTACKTLGYSQQQLLKLSVRDIDPLFPMQNWPQHWQDIKKNGSLIFESTHKRKDGSTYPVEITANYVNFEGKEYNFAFAVEITKRKEADRERSRLLKTLAIKNEELESIIYAASHDLRSPLINIHGFSSELENSCRTINSIVTRQSPELAKKLDSTLNTDIPQALDYIINSTSKMDSLLFGLLKISRLGSEAVKYETIDMNRIIADIIKNSEYVIKESHIDVITCPLPYCVGDTSQINQVFSNLVDNAIKHRDNTAKAFIKITGKKENNKSVYCVEDNGLGIAAEHVEKIFEIFHRLEPERIAGEGLGLTIVKRILQRHNGSIWVESQPGIGSKFFVSLPNNAENKAD